MIGFVPENHFYFLGWKHSHCQNSAYDNFVKKWFYCFTFLYFFSKFYNIPYLVFIVHTFWPCLLTGLSYRSGDPSGKVRISS